MQDARIPVGPLDFDALREVRHVFEEEGLVDRVGLDDPLDPQQLEIRVTDGLSEGRAGRFDVKWTTRGYYSFHYSQSGLDFRFDSHPKAGVSATHFHTPPNAGTAVRSCIDVGSAELVARAVHKCWRAAYETDDPTMANSLDNPP